MSKKHTDLGSFLSNLAQTANTATADTIKEMKSKMEKAQQAQIEAQLTAVFNEMQGKVANLRQIRAQEKAVLKEIKELEAKANRVAAGEEEPEVVPVVRRVRVPVTATMRRPPGGARISSEGFWVDLYGYRLDADGNRII